MSRRREDRDLRRSRACLVFIYAAAHVHVRSDGTMNFVARIIRFFPKLRFRILGLATIKDIPTTKFKGLIDEFLSNGWRKTYEYKGFDAWIDYGCIKLKNGNTKLKLEWDNWTEGSIEGPNRLIETIANKYLLSVTYEWRWSEYDEL